MKKKNMKKKKTIKRKNKNNIETYVYILQSTIKNNKSYVGVSNNLIRRLQQHNGEKSGGARFTRSSRPWKFFAIFSLKNRHDALSMEWKIKHKKKKSDGIGVGSKVSSALRIAIFFHGCKRVM